MPFNVEDDSTRPHPPTAGITPPVNGMTAAAA
jgi:hypothetical protein